MRSPATSSSLFHAVKTVRLGWQRSGLRSRRHRLLVQAAGSRLVSTSSSSPPEPSENAESTTESAPVASEHPTLPTPPPPLPVERPERGRRLKTTTSIETIDWPAELDVLWAPSEDLEADAPDTATLPPPQILDEALNNLLITLHPQTQNRAVYASPHGPAVEPTLALYCPIEGGDYVIDATVKEMARRIGAEVLVLDSVQLAAGEWGSFGAAASMLHLPRNPLHFRATSTTSAPSSSSAEEDDDDDYGNNSVPTAQMLLTVMSPSSPHGTVMSASKLSNPQPSKAKQFFDALVNMQSLEGIKSPPVPRIIYIRDFPTLAPTSATWYRPLLNAVRQRRRGPIASPSSPVTNPTTIIFGITPPITPPEVISSPSPSNIGRGLLSVVMNRRAGASPVASASKPSKTDWNEDDDATKARESRLRRRLKKWERGDPSLLDELPTLMNQEEGEEGDSKRDNVVMLGGAAIPLPFFQGSQGSSSNRSPSEADNKTSFFRTSILVPSIRSTADERDARIDRRREINELTARMAIGAVGGVLEHTPAASLIPEESNLLDESESETETDTTPSSSDAATPEVSVSAHEQMWEEWGKRVELWMTVKHIADRAVGSVVANNVSYAQKQSLEPTLVPWDAVSNAWTIQRSASELRKTWFKEAVKASQAEKTNSDAEAENPLPTLDEVVERIKNDPDIDSHEQRLLPCIVDPATMPTGFNQVHLPTKTIDSVRTIVSLPLLHPQAFQQGILKEHSITGCLLFGPPGTGKTLVVRALAKEAGCHMMNVSPSDVMDMYVGEGEKLVKAVFALARKLSPCVVFLDEIDALLGARSSGRDSGSSAAYRGVITEFMQEMDGLKTMPDSNVIVIGATNRPFDLDDAVLRRLPRRLLVDLPGEKEREAILKIMLRHEELASDVDIKELAKRTESFSGSDLKHLCVSAAVDAVKETVELPWLVSEKDVSIPTPAKQESTQQSSEQPVDEKETPEESTQSDSEAPSTASKDETPPQSETSSNAPEDKPVPNVSRILYQRHFSKAMKEITPSSSEATGTLAALRKWNEEFGEGHRDRKRKQIWGKGRFGFTDPANFSEEDGRVLPSTASAGENTSTTISRP